MAHAHWGSVLRQIQQFADAPDTRQLNDHDLLERFQSHRDQNAFAAVVRRHGGMVWRVCRHVLGQEQDAEDAFQATFVVLAHQAGALLSIESVGGWLHGVAYRTALRARRDLSRRRAREMQTPTITPRNSSEDIAWREVQAILDEEIQHLPDKQRAVFVLCCSEGLSQAQAARQLRIKEGTVSSRLAHARRHLQKRLTRRGIVLSAVLGALSVSQGVAAAAPAPLVAATISLALQSALHASVVAGVLSTPVAALTQGVLRTMFLSRLAVVCLTMLGVAATGTGVCLLCSTRAAEQPAADDQTNLVALPDDAHRQEEGKDEAGDRQKSANNLKLLGLAMHSHVDTYGLFPPAAVRDKDGKALLSWRVLLLPDLGQKELFKQFKLDEAWDSAHNKKLLEKMPSVYAPVRGQPKQPFTTYYQVFTGPGTIFDGAEGRRVRDIVDGTSNTILMCEAAEPVPWTKPADLVYARDMPVPKVGGLFTRGFSLALADGSAHYFKKKWNAQEEQMMRRFIQYSDGEIVDFKVLKP